MASPTAEFVFRDQDVSISSELGSTLPWARFIDVWEKPEFWMMFLTRSQFITLPVADLSEEAPAFPRSRLPGKILIPVKYRAIPLGLGTRGRHSRQTDGGWRGRRGDTWANLFWRRTAATLSRLSVFTV
jgi:hypothetical protein